MPDDHSYAQTTNFAAESEFSDSADTGSEHKDTSGMPTYAVELEGLTKVYQAAGNAAEKRALSSVDLKIPRGSIFGLLGPNGAGKSTLINILAGLVNKTSGSAKIWGHDIVDEMRPARMSIGVVPQELNFDPFFTPLELLELQAGLYGVPKSERRSEEILEVMGLSDKAKTYTRSLSGGMKRRLMVGKAMVHSPPVLVLDEPTAGVDIELRQQLWAYVRELNKRGTTILLTTHYLEEAEELCDEIAIINHGQVIACDTTQALLARIESKTLTLTLGEDLDSLPSSFTAFHVEQKSARELTFTYKSDDGQLAEILKAANTAGLSILDLTTDQGDLEDIFLQLTRGAHNATA
ncbi:ABC transporter ATP-binding protein [uncultured Kiloniella sp.]|uniref:ABC transporter ATP-binding protein n=2 Tax=Kiloniella TaxID=454159 RepID=UPI00260DCF3B|nr:ABC transporter ATP-binding protein [uncultured Kiloniella sp.]